MGNKFNKKMCNVLYDFSKMNNRKKVGRPRLSDEERRANALASKLKYYYKMKFLKQKAKSF